MRHLAILSLCGVLAACVRANVVPLGPADVYEPVPWQDVALYESEADVPGEYVKLGIINAKGDYQFTGEPKMARKMRKKAAKIGANAVVLRNMRDPGVGGKVADYFLGVGGDRKGQAVAIRVVDGEEPPRGLVVHTPGETPERAGPAGSRPVSFSFRSPDGPWDSGDLGTDGTLHVDGSLFVEPTEVVWLREQDGEPAAYRIERRRFERTDSGVRTVLTLSRVHCEPLTQKERYDATWEPEILDRWRERCATAGG